MNQATWVLFPSERDDEPSLDPDLSDGSDSMKKRVHPYRFSGKNYSFDQANDSSILENIRRWSLDYFANNSVINRSNYQKLKELH